MNYVVALALFFSFNLQSFAYTPVVIDTKESLSKVYELVRDAKNLNPSDAPFAIYSATDESISQDHFIPFLQKEFVEKSSQPKHIFLILEVSSSVWVRANIKKISQSMDTEHVQLDVEYLQPVLVDSSEESSEIDFSSDFSNSSQLSEETTLETVKTIGKNLSLSKFRIVVQK